MLSSTLSFAYTHALLGGILIGLAAFLLLLSVGRVAGISGLLNQALLLNNPPIERAWRRRWLISLMVGAGLLHIIPPAPFAPVPIAPAPTTMQALDWIVLIVGGLFVGFGTVLGNGCTSGHGVCGIARGSKRSIVATLLFVAVAMGVHFLSEHMR